MNEKRIVTKREMKSLKNCILHGLYLGLYGFIKYLAIPFSEYLRFGILRLFTSNIKSPSIADGVTIWFPWHVNIGKQVSLNQGVYIDGFGGVTIKDGTRIAAYTCINTSDHQFDDKDKLIKDQGYVVSSVTIEEDVWIGVGVTINKGVVIGKGSVIGSGAVVTKDIPPYSIAAGVPCAVIAKRGDA